MTLINEQLHLVQLELDEEKQKSLAQAEKIIELQLNLRSVKKPNGFGVTHVTNNSLMRTP